MELEGVQSPEIYIKNLGSSAVAVLMLRIRRAFSIKFKNQKLWWILQIRWLPAAIADG